MSGNYYMKSQEYKMAEKIPTYDEALALLKEFNKTESLLKHAYAVEGAMRYIAGTMGEDKEKWGIIGLVHDIDYEQYPDRHCHESQKILEGRGWPAEYVRAVVSHGWGICTDIEPKTNMEKVLYTIDELTGLITAAALVRPSKSLSDLEVKSVMKKWKDKTFAAGVNRSVIEKGAAMLNIELSDIIGRTILGMREVAGKIGL
jgi:putative nucleotidyltransferase with HDIG domain